MKKTVKIEVEVDNLDPSLCANDCAWNDNNQYCQLFMADLEGSGIRASECRGREL